MKFIVLLDIGIESSIKYKIQEIKNQISQHNYQIQFKSLVIHSFILFWGGRVGFGGLTPGHHSLQRGCLPLGFLTLVDL